VSDLKKEERLEDWSRSVAEKIINEAACAGSPPGQVLLMIQNALVEAFNRGSVGGRGAVAKMKETLETMTEAIVSVRRADKRRLAAAEDLLIIVENAIVGPEKDAGAMAHKFMQGLQVYKRAYHGRTFKADAQSSG